MTDAVPPGAEPITIELVYSYSDISDLADEEVEGDEPVDDDAGSMTIDAIPLDGGRFRVDDPVSLTFFGPHGPGMPMGTIFEAMHSEGRRYRYVKVIEKPEVWGRHRACPQSALENSRIREILDALRERGGRWEWCVGNLLVQAPFNSGTREPEAAVSDLLQQIDERLEGHSEDRSI